MERRSAVVLGVVLGVLLALGVPGRSELNPNEYEKITQCVLVRERAALAGKKVQITGRYLEGSQFCHVLRKAGINTKDYLCFALGKPCILRMYLRKDHPQVALLQGLRDGDLVTVYGTFDYLASNYNYLILDGLSVPEPAGKSASGRQ